MENLKQILTVHKKAVILVGIFMLLLLGGFASQNFRLQVSLEEVDLIFDAEGPFAQIFPRKDGNAIILNLKRTSSYDSISYELAYTSLINETAVEGNKVLDEEGEAPVGGVIDRGVVGTINTDEKKGEYEQEILFGTCSRNVCKYDKGVENGTLTLYIQKGNKKFKMVTLWRLQQPDVALGKFTSGDGHFIYSSNADRSMLSNVGYSIVNELTGVPKLPNGKEVFGKVYSLNVPIAKVLPEGEVTIEYAQNPSSEAKIYRFDQSTGEWQELDTKIDGSKLSAKASGAGIFATLTSK